MRYTNLILLVLLGLATAAPAAKNKRAKRKRRAKQEALTNEQLAAQPKPKANIPVRFKLDKPGYVTLVIDDAEGRRVLNLINDTWFEAGTHTLYWDGYDVGHFLPNEFADVKRKRVAAGTYTLRGLIHDDIELKYQVAVQSPGNPPWHTPDNTGGWMADHTPPGDVLFLPQGSPLGKQPQLLLVASGAEAGHGIIWVDESGRKLYGTKMHGMSGMYSLTTDPGPKADPRVQLYGLGKAGIVAVNQVDMDTEADQLMQRRCREKWKKTGWEDRPKRDCAAYNRVLLVSLPLEGVIRCYDLSLSKEGDIRKRQGTMPLPDVRGLTFNSKGNLYVLVGTTLKRFRPNLTNPQKPALGKGVTVVRGLEDPRRVLLHGTSFYISDWGKSHQVKVYDHSGKLRRTIGKPGGQQFGLYDERGMCRPAGMAVDSKGQLWVAEQNYAPKRVSLRNAATGKFIKGLYGPPKYGGGGHWDPKDPSRFYYSSGLQGIEFKVDWTTGESKPRGIFHHKTYNAVKERLQQPGDIGARCPDTSVYTNGRHYMVNSFFGSAYFGDGPGQVFLFDDAKCLARPVVYIGFPGKTPETCTFAAAAKQDPKLAAFLKEIYKQQGHWKSRLVVWSDLNVDGVPQADEIQHRIFPRAPVKRDFQRIAFNDDLTVMTTGGVRIPAPRFNARGVPVYDMNKMKLIPDGYFLSDTVLGDDGHFIFTMGRFQANYREMVAYKDGKPSWRINGVRQNTAAFKGQLISCQRNIGFPFTPKGAKDCEMFALNGYRGNVPLITTDGLYVTDLGGDARVVPVNSAPEAKPGMIIDDVSWGEEHFWPALDQLADGRVIFTAGGRCENIAFEVLHLDSIKRLPRTSLPVTAAMLANKAPEYIEAGEFRTIERNLAVAILPQAPVLDGKLNEWAKADWVEIDKRTKTYAALAVRGTTLYAAWKTSDPKLLQNNLADGLPTAFASGGGLDLMIRTDPTKEQPKRNKRLSKNAGNVAAGDIRIFVTRLRDPLRGPVKAIRYQQIGGPGRKQEYTSPVGHVSFDSVKEISSQVKLAQQGGVYELAIPLSVIGLKPKTRLKTIGDIGILTGNGAETRSRLYWSNRSSTMVSDIPSEARLLPYAWGTWKFTPLADIGKEPAKAEKATAAPARRKAKDPKIRLDL